MLETFIIVLREGFEAFLIVAITLAYLRKTGRSQLIPAVHWAIGTSLALSAALGYVLLRGVNQALWEAVLGAVTVVMVGTLVIHMWRTAARFKQLMEQELEAAATRRTTWAAFAGVFLFIVLMITREGMETALMLYQLRDKALISGALAGIAGAAAIAWMWTKLGRRINLKRFFQVTSIYLLLFMGQVAVYSFHEFAEAGLLPNSDELHAATEIFSPYGLYGKWFSLVIVALCGAWLATMMVFDSVKTAAHKSK